MAVAARKIDSSGADERASCRYMVLRAIKPPVSSRMVVHASGVSASAGVLAMLVDAAMVGTHVALLLPVLLEPRCHLCSSSCWSGEGE